jgi:tetratricopeptide (TPR) repeat protein
MIQQLNAADPALKLDQEQTLRKWTASLRLKEAELLLENNKITEAIAAFNRIEQMDSTVISAQSWNNLCWQGALGGHPAQVLDACEKAVHAATAEQSWEIRDSRGLARALTGNRQGAIEDFEVYIAKANNEKLKKQRQDWVYALRVSKNPFTKEELATLRDQ